MYFFIDIKCNLLGHTDDREADLSHPVHSDNCMIQPDGSCIPDALAYVQRHYRYLKQSFFVLLFKEYGGP